MAWENQQPLDYSPNGDDIDSASQKLIAQVTDLYEKLNRVRNFDASPGQTVGDSVPFSFKIDTSYNPPAFLMRNGTNSAWVLVGWLGENMGITPEDIGAMPVEGLITKIGMGAENNLPGDANTYDMYIAFDTRRLYIYLTGAWRVLLSLRFDDILDVEQKVIMRNEVAENGANKVPRLNSVGQGEFDITGSAHKLGGKNLFLPEIHDQQVMVFNGARDRWEVAPRDDIHWTDVSTTGEIGKIVQTDANGYANIDITGNARKIAFSVIDVSNLQEGDVLVYNSVAGTFVNRKGAVVNENGVVDANVSGSSAKWGGKAIQTIAMTDGQILVWSEANQAFINRNQGAIGTGRALVIRQDGTELANYNGDAYRVVDLITPYLRVASHEYHVGDKCFSTSLPYSLYLECSTAGVTAALEPDYTGVTVGDTVADGSVIWTIRQFANTAGKIAEAKSLDNIDTTATYAKGDVIFDGTKSPSTCYVCVQATA